MTAANPHFKQQTPTRESEVFEEDVGKIAPAERLMGIATMVYENRRKLLGTAGSWFILDVVGMVACLLDGR